jgi:hypothetical protein
MGRWAGEKPPISPFSGSLVSQVSQGDIHMPKDMPDPATETIAETDNFMAWKANEPDGEVTYHLELNNVTLHFFTEEWDEFLQLVKHL